MGCARGSFGINQAAKLMSRICAHGLSFSGASPKRVALDPLWVTSDMSSTIDLACWPPWSTTSTHRALSSRAIYLHPSFLQPAIRSGRACHGLGSSSIQPQCPALFAARRPSGTPVVTSSRSSAGMLHGLFAERFSRSDGTVENHCSSMRCLVIGSIVLSWMSACYSIPHAAARCSFSHCTDWLAVLTRFHSHAIRICGPEGVRASRAPPGRQRFQSQSLTNSSHHQSFWFITSLSLVNCRAPPDILALPGIGSTSAPALPNKFQSNSFCHCIPLSSDTHFHFSHTPNLTPARQLLLSFLYPLHFKKNFIRKKIINSNPFDYSRFPAYFLNFLIQTSFCNFPLNRFIPYQHQ
ncbi:hypothetical protein O181_021176 [Austropuccinia psidii MF-1]|uniref:Uncharacterized protein n=1 Tax=Austropuccinia psidii MF-1 TaxID=1389203 RepID=A0A9Q3CEY8_9BASI|nr:hypothetical protein [Austropuccinia psidii MF-1]